MTLDEAIKRAEEVMVENLEKTKDRNASDPIAISCGECADEHRQLAEWLKDYKRLKEQEPIDCANAEHDVDGCLGYSTDRGGYSYCQTCLECPKASINNWDKEQDKPTGTYEEMVTFQLGLIATMLADISKSLAILADKAEGSEE